jgi:hypothetical protein
MHACMHAYAHTYKQPGTQRILGAGTHDLVCEKEQSSYIGLSDLIPEDLTTKFTVLIGGTRTPQYTHRAAASHVL